MEIVSTCIYCGCGCKLRYEVKENKIVRVSGFAGDDISEGKPCIKGLTIGEVVEDGRIKSPMIRVNDKLKEASWEEAYRLIYERTRDLSPEEVFFVPSGKTTNEDCFIVQKFARVVFKTNNVDGCCSRLCHVATVAGLLNTIGNGGNPYRMRDVYDTDCLLLIGSNPVSNYPVLFDKILKAKKRGMKIISVQSVNTEINDFADLAIIIQPGTETAFLNGLTNSVIEQKSYERWVESLEGFDELKNLVREYTPRVVCEVCKIREEILEEASDLVVRSKKFGAIHGMGLTQHINAIENVHSLMNLLILKNGRLLTCRGEINVQGVGDTGCTPAFPPLGSFLKKEELEKLWGVDISERRGLNLIEAFLISPVKAAFVCGFNPAQSLPNLTQVHENLKRMFLVQIDSYFNLTSKFAKVILPSPLLIERNGTITNGERRVRLVRKVINTGWSKPEWLIFKELSSFFGMSKHFGYKHEKQIFEEICKIMPAYKRVNADEVYSGKDYFADKQIKFYKFIPEKFEGVEDIRSERYPLLLTTFRSKWHFLTDEATSKSKTLNKFPDGPFFYLNEEDATKLGIKDGDEVEVSSRVASLRGKVKLDKRIPPRMVGAHFHFESLPINKLFPTQFDEETLTPNFKLVAVNLRKVDE